MNDSARADATRPLVAPGKPVKLVVWDLDHTLWDGVLLENEAPRFFAALAPVIAGLDQLGILQSIASRNDREAATAHLRRLGIMEYFLVPQIDWCAKSQSISAIATALNIGLDSVLFIDDQDFERQEVQFAHPQVRTLHAADAPHLLVEGSIRPAVVTDDAPRRRLRYLEDEARTRCEKEFSGAPQLFLGSIDLELTIDKACAADLDRAEELVIRTNQLNSSGITYSRDELQTFLDSSTHTLLIARLKDRFGDYGAIGIALLETGTPLWTLKLILVSCRVLSRGIGSVLLSYLAQRAAAAKATLRVEFRDTGKNRPMKIALMMTGFTRREIQAESVHLYRDDDTSPVLPPYLTVISRW